MYRARTCRHRCFPAGRNCRLAAQPSPPLSYPFPGRQLHRGAPSPGSPALPQGAGRGHLTLSCWKLGCRDTWASARVCRAPRTPSRTSPIHSARRAAILRELSRRPRPGPAVWAERGRRAGQAGAAGETPIYGPGLAPAQGPRTAHWRLVTAGWGGGAREAAAASPLTGLLMQEAGPSPTRTGPGLGAARTLGLWAPPTRARGPPPSPNSLSLPSPVTR